MDAVAIDRPGLGLSDPHHEKTLTSWADDTRQLPHDWIPTSRMIKAIENDPAQFEKHVSGFGTGDGLSGNSSLE